MRWIASVLIALIALIAVPAWGAVGSITNSVNAPPSIQRKGTTIAAPKGTGVEMMDAVKTTQGKAGITFEDKTRVDITENSKFVIDEFVYDPNSNKGGKLAIKVALGTVRYASGQIAKNNPQSVSVDTPTATIGVRGTDFSATVDELGRSTIILLPSCPKGWQDIERDCVTGSIHVTTEEGMVVMNQAFQATKVDSRETKPLKPVILKLTEDMIDNILVLSMPQEIRRAEADRDRSKQTNRTALDTNFLEEDEFVGGLEKDDSRNMLSQNLLDNDFLANILDIIDAAQQKVIVKPKSALLPDYLPSSGVKVEIDDFGVTLCREAGGDTQCITTPKTQDSTITQIQGSDEIMNRVNTGGGTIINATQN